MPENQCSLFDNGPAGRRKRSVVTSKRMKREEQKGEDSKTFFVDRSNCPNAVGDGDTIICPDAEQRSSAQVATFYISVIISMIFQ